MADPAMLIFSPTCIPLSPSNNKTQCMKLASLRLTIWNIPQGFVPQSSSRAGLQLEEAVEAFPCMVTVSLHAPHSQSVAS